MAESDEEMEATFEVTLRFVAGQEYEGPFIMQDILISGKYNEKAIVEWDGTNSKLVK